MKHLIVCVCIVLLTASAKAEESAQLVLEVRATRVEPSELERALRAELASGRTTGEAEAAGHLELSDGSNDIVRLSYRDASGKLATRDLRIPREDPEALEKITLAAANLVRDQSGLAAELAALAAAKQAAEPPEKPPAAEPPAPPPEESEYNPCRTTPVLAFGADLVPGVGTSSSAMGRDAARHVSLNFAGSYSAGVRGFELSIGFNIDRRGVCGYQGAVGFNFALGPVRGVQHALVNLAMGRVRGAQIGLVNFTRDRAGAQFGLGNLAAGGSGSQLGLANISLGTTGVQLGIGNIAGGKVRSVQLGVGNFARSDVPVQIGVVNVSANARAPIGVVSIVRDGRLTFDTWISENGTILAGLVHGGETVHNFYAAGARVGPKGTRVAYSFGIGVRLFGHPRFQLDLDGLYEQLSRVDSFNLNTTVARLRLAGVITLFDRLGLLLAAGYAVMDTREAGEVTQALFGESVLARGEKQDHVVYGFPSAAIGLRIALSDRR